VRSAMVQKAFRRSYWQRKFIRFWL